MQESAGLHFGTDLFRTQAAEKLPPSLWQVPTPRIPTAREFGHPDAWPLAQEIWTQ